MGHIQAGEAAVVDLLGAAAGAAGLEDGQLGPLLPGDLQGPGGPQAEGPVHADPIPVQDLSRYDLRRGAGDGQAPSTSGQTGITRCPRT